MKRRFGRTFTISMTLGIISGCELPSTINFLSNNTATATLTATGSAVVNMGQSFGGAPDNQSSQATSSGNAQDELKKAAEDLKKAADTLASSSMQASPTVVIATTTIVVQPATQSERVDTSFDEVVGEFSGRIPLRLADGSIGSASVEVNDVVWSYVKNRVTAVFTGDVSGVYSHDEVGKAWERESFETPSGNLVKRHAAFFQVVNATESVGPIASIDWTERVFLMTDGSTTSIPESLGKGNYPPEYLNRYAIVGHTVSIWGWSNPPSISRKKKKFDTLELGVIKGEPVYWVYDPLHRRVLVLSYADDNRNHFYRLAEDKV